MMMSLMMSLMMTLMMHDVIDDVIVVSLMTHDDVTLQTRKV